MQLFAILQTLIRKRFIALIGAQLKAKKFCLVLVETKTLRFTTCLIKNFTQALHV